MGGMVYTSLDTTKLVWHLSNSAKNIRKSSV